MKSRIAIRPFDVLFIAAATVLAMPSFAVADESALQRCGAIEDAASRLECYDEIAKQTTARQQPIDNEEPNDKVSPQDEMPEQQLSEEPSPDQVKSAEEDPDTGSFTTTVTRCEKSYDGKYLFFFENGQVWKQVKTDRESHRNCNFTVTVTRDWFGYKMQRDDNDRRIRISRVK